MARRGEKQIHWYPGHMATATRELKTAWRHIDCVVEVADARIPEASRNPVFLSFEPQKPHVLIYSHADLADHHVTNDWLKKAQDHELQAMACNLNQRSDIRVVRAVLMRIRKPLFEKAKTQGRRARPLRVLVVGIPNTGKSTLINQLVGRRKAAVEARPGVTRKQSWLRAGSELHLLDTPGILPMKLDDAESAHGLAATGAIRDTILPLEDVALWLYRRLWARYPALMEERYGVAADAAATPLEGFSAAALRMGCVEPGGTPDLDRFARQLLDDFRTGRIGRVSLQWPKER
ncbi:MAG: ribosome biogenesis GTPase YlqF [Saccharofermentanales bacterium]|jgi:ribosome biogenesis GTPase A